MNGKILALVLSGLLFLLVVELVRREKLSFKYALGWFGVIAVGFILSLFEKVVFQMAFTLGFELPSNFIFFTAIACITFLALLLTIFLCQQNERNDRIAQKLGLLEEQVEKLVKQKR